ncbi:bifunctional folylpolyglutamate synthase/dihydrofolate synthase [Geomonas silvestris]|uniref:Dihydrofolate synthase/folylpolyglutamate synthase n=1 Tax=Geomonas silvestris TaxID=2740184 RepID=A0A6V8MML8_9BACT|nr:folylpolyglutamate synthase/dihydrofolate synthase family protein [Geomonas silvestris]GFO61271.1 bifunctional folylpolyglutamate synthase/dihydrofolate synthase [Geomonas silvestris]
MTYAETLTHIFALGRFGIKPGLERISLLLEALGNPQHAFAALHVVGTNGKGSTASQLSTLLASGGYRTGLFTSPHLISFTERIRVNGAEIAEEDVVRLAGRVLAAAPPETTFFEIVTALAALHFAEAGVEIAVFEAGMGGRLDATNVFDGVLGIITPVSLDHTDYLGGSIAEIAREKVGICKPGRPIVSAQQAPEAAQLIEAQAAALSAPLYRLGEEFDAWWEGGNLSYRGIGMRLDALSPGLAGAYQSGNIACALAAAELLAGVGFPVPARAFPGAVAEARWPGRLELFEGTPRLILDGAHNPAGARALAEALGGIPYQRLFLVIGVMGDKELSGILGPLVPLAERVFTVSPDLERALPAEALAASCAEYGVPVEAAGPVRRGIELARAAAGPDDLILVCGSLFTVGEARGILLSRDFHLFRG